MLCNTYAVTKQQQTSSIRIECCVRLIVNKVTTSLAQLINQFFENLIKIPQSRVNNGIIEARQVVMYTHSHTVLVWLVLLCK